MATKKPRNITDKLKELEEEARIKLSLDLENFYQDLDGYYQKDEEIFDDKQKLFFMLAFTNKSIQSAADICGFKNKESVSQECSKKLFKYLKSMFNVDKIKWSEICYIIENDKGYIDSSIEKIKNLTAKITVSANEPEETLKLLRKNFPNCEINREN